MNKRRALVTWVDSVTLCERPWVDAKEAKQLRPATISSVGFLIYEGYDCIVLALSDGGAEMGSVKCVPACAIVEMTIF